MVCMTVMRIESILLLLSIVQESVATSLHSSYVASGLIRKENHLQGQDLELQGAQHIVSPRGTGGRGAEIDTKGLQMLWSSEVKSTPKRRSRREAGKDDYLFHANPSASNSSTSASGNDAYLFKANAPSPSLGGPGHSPNSALGNDGYLFHATPAAPQQSSSSAVAGDGYLLRANATASQHISGGHHHSGPSSSSAAGGDGYLFHASPTASQQISTGQQSTGGNPGSTVGDDGYLFHATPQSSQHSPNDGVGDDGYLFHANAPSSRGHTGSQTDKADDQEVGGEDDTDVAGEPDDDGDVGGEAGEQSKSGHVDKVEVEKPEEESGRIVAEPVAAPPVANSPGADDQEVGVGDWQAPNLENSSGVIPDAEGQNDEHPPSLPFESVSDCADHHTCEAGQFCDLNLKCADCDHCVAGDSPTSITGDCQICSTGSCDGHADCETGEFCDLVHACKACNMCEDGKNSFDGSCTFCKTL